MADALQDIWSRWLLNRRFGGTPELMKRMVDFLTVLDVGCGDGLIAFGALEKFKTCRVIFSDISEDLLKDS